MVHVIDAIKTRRSGRAHSSRRVPLRGLRQVLEAAGWAPSAHNAQPWRFIVLTGEAKKQELAKAMANAWMADLAKQGVLPQVRENLCKMSGERFTRAPVLIIACVTMLEKL